MFDGQIRRIIDPAMERLGRRLAHAGVTANSVTYAGFLLGMGSMVAITLSAYWLGLAAMLASRLCDGLDGAVARASRKSDFGGLIDIVLDFAFYGAIPLAFALSEPGPNAVPAAVLIFAFYVNGSSFLAYAVMAEKRALESHVRGDKSLFFTTGLAEATETIAAFALMCIFPAAFPVIAYAFAAICLYTAFSRLVLAHRNFR